MRFPWTDKPHQDPTQSAQDEFWRQCERFGDRSFSEIEDAADAKLCLCFEVYKLSASKNFEATRDLLRQGNERFPNDASLRFLLATVYEQLGNEVEALLELSLLLATRPDRWVTHTHLARLLLKQGRRDDARAVLEAGWRYAQQGYRGRQLAAKRAEFFSMLDHPSAVTTGVSDP
jgi:tetratricopeptide (TPR) repeat protein